MGCCPPLRVGAKRMQKPLFSSEESIVSLTDVKLLYISMWKRLVKCAILSAGASLLLTGGLGVTYQAKASFKERAELASSENSIRDFMGGMMAPPLPEAGSYMKSYQVLKPLVEKLGLQIVFSPSEWNVSALLRRYVETVKAESRQWIPDLDSFVFEDVRYEGEEIVPLQLFFLTQEQFAIYDGQKKKEIARGIVGEPLSLEDLSIQLTLRKAPKSANVGSYYVFHIYPWAWTADALRDQIKIKNDRANHTLIHIAIHGRDRHLAARILNELMSQYHSYLKRDYDQVAKEQVAYLEERRALLTGRMEELFDQHASYLGMNVREKGFVELEQEVKSLLLPYQQMREKIVAIEVELSRLAQIEKEGSALSSFEREFQSDELRFIPQKIQDLKLQKDCIELSVFRDHLPPLQADEGELREVRESRLAVVQAMQEVFAGAEISSAEIGPGIPLWARGEARLNQRKDLLEDLETYARFLSMKEKMIQSKRGCCDNLSYELEGMDLESARSLFAESNRKLDVLEESLRQYKLCKKEIADPSFELGSLSQFLKDPLCQKIIGEASALGLQIKDQKYHTDKEEKRWQEEIALHRKILIEHLDQMIQVEEMNAILMREKIKSIQKLTLDCIHRQISALEEQMSDGLKQRLQSLVSEKGVLEKKMEAIRDSLASILPEKWQFEKRLHMKTLMLSKAIEAMTEAVESKTMAAHLHHVQSKPLDFATPPLRAQPPYLLLIAGLSAFGCPFFLFSLSLIRRIFRGFPLSLEKLRALHLPVIGELKGPSCGSFPFDLEVLRRMAFFSSNGKVISLLAGQGPDYADAFGEYLSRSQRRSILLRCDFLSSSQKDEGPGIFQFWKGEALEPFIYQGKGFDYMLPGGSTPFGTEIIQSSSFKKLLELLKKRYDGVFLYFRSSLASAEALAALQISDKAIVTVCEEQTQELTPFIDWGYDEDPFRITFITG